MRKLPPGLVNPGMKEMAILSILIGTLIGLTFYRLLLTGDAPTVGIVLILMLFASALNSSLPKGRSRFLCLLAAWLSTGLGCTAGLSIRSIIERLFR